MKMNATIAGVGMTRFGKHLDITLKGLAGEAIREALADAQYLDAFQDPADRRGANDAVDTRGGTACHEDCQSLLMTHGYTSISGIEQTAQVYQRVRAWHPDRLIQTRGPLLC